MKESFGEFHNTFLLNIKFLSLEMYMQALVHCVHISLCASPLRSQTHTTVFSSRCVPCLHGILERRNIAPTPPNPLPNHRSTPKRCILTVHSHCSMRPKRQCNISSLKMQTRVRNAWKGHTPHPYETCHMSCHTHCCIGLGRPAEGCCGAGPSHGLLKP